MFVTELGITSDTRLTQYAKAPVGRVSKLVKRVTDCRDVHIVKTFHSNQVTEFAIVTLVKLLE